MEQIRATEDVCERFNKYPWHDSKFLTMHLVHGGDRSTGDLVLDLLLIQREEGRQQLRDATLVIRDCTVINIKLDVEAKAACGHDIAGASCEGRSEFMELLEQTELKHEANPFAGFVHFRLMLCPPGGEVQAIARDFEVVMNDA